MDTRMKRIYPLYLTYPTLFLYVLFFVLPLIASVFLSFTDWDISRGEINFNGFENFTSLFTDESFTLSLKNTLLITAVIVIGRNVLGLMLALALNAPLKSRNIMRTAFYLPAVLSYVVVGLIFTSLFQMDGVVNSFIGLFSSSNDIEWLGDPEKAIWIVMVLDIWKWTGFMMMIYIAGLQSIPNEYYEASKIDGANSVQQTFLITIPMLMPSININVTLSFIGGLKIFEQVMILTGGGPGKSTYVLNFLIFKVFGSGMYGKATAMNLILSVFVFIIATWVSAFFRKREVEL